MAEALREATKLNVGGKNGLELNTLHLFSEADAGGVNGQEAQNAVCGGAVACTWQRARRGH